MCRAAVVTWAVSPPLESSLVPLALGSKTWADFCRLPCPIVLRATQSRGCAWHRQSICSPSSGWHATQARLGVGRAEN